MNRYILGFILGLLGAFIFISGTISTGQIGRDVQLEVTDSDLKTLLEMASIIRADAENMLERIIPEERRSLKYPKLSYFGPVQLNMTDREVQESLGKQERTEAYDSGYRWVYRTKDKRSLYVVFDMGGKVITILSDSQVYQVPFGLSVGSLLEQFEKVYGGPQQRSSKMLSKNLDLLEYPFSNLALAVSRTDHPVVQSIMIFKVRNP